MWIYRIRCSAYRAYSQVIVCLQGLELVRQIDSWASLPNTSWPHQLPPMQAQAASDVLEEAQV